jgi:hypothetical protein
MSHENDPHRRSAGFRHHSCGGGLCRGVTGPMQQADYTPFGNFPLPHRSGSRRPQIYIANGCVYCHSQSIRAIDWGMAPTRIAQAGDYVQDRPILLGSQRTGVDLSQEGGEHPDDWHIAHFINPRYTRPNSIMPPFEYLGMEKIELLTPTSKAWASSRPTSAWPASASGKKNPSGPTRPASMRMSAGSRKSCPRAGAIFPIPMPPPIQPGPRAHDLPGLLHRLPRTGGRRYGPMPSPGSIRRRYNFTILKDARSPAASSTTS